MSRVIQKRLAGNEGLTLIEVTVVVMVIAVLLAVAIPAYLSFRKSAQDQEAQPEMHSLLPPDQAAQDREAQSEIRTVLLTEKAFWLNSGAYTATAADITALEPNSNINASPARGVAIALSAASSQTLCITRTSASGVTFAVWESATLGTYFGNTDLSAADCPAAVPHAFVQTGW